MSNAPGRPPIAVGRYELHGVIACGGMASVHYGRLLGPAGFSRAVAIKRMHPQLTADKALLAMFNDEARIAARVRHPNVVQMLDVVAEREELFLVMEYIHGESLARLLNMVRSRGEKVPPAIASAIVSGVLRGLQAAHEARSAAGEPLGIVHRDISPQNVLIGSDGVARVADFGIAKANAELHHTNAGTLKGKVAYMAPEQLRAKPVDARTDVYAVGVVLWETLTALRLFEGENAGLIVEQVLVGFHDPPGSRVPELPPAIDEITMRALEHDPGKRYPSAEAMAVALEGAVAPARAVEVAAWVAALAGAELAAHSARVKQMETLPPLTASSEALALVTADILLGDASPAPSAVAPRSGRGLRRGVAAGLGVGFALVLVGTLWLANHARERHEATAPAAARAASAPAIPDALPATQATLVTATPAPLPSVDTTAAPAPIGPRSVRRRTRSPQQDACNPPFIRDGAGQKVWKRECL